MLYRNMLIKPGVMILLFALGNHQARSHARLSNPPEGDQAVADHVKRDSILKRLHDPQLIARTQQDLVGGSMETESLINQLRPFRNDPVVIQELLRLEDFCAIEWVGNPPKPKVVFCGSLDAWLSRRRPAREILLEMGPDVAPELVAIFIEQVRYLAAGAEVAPAQAINEDWKFQAIYSILRSSKDRSRATLDATVRQVVKNPKDRITRQACHHLIHAMMRDGASFGDKHEAALVFIELTK